MVSWHNDALQTLYSSVTDRASTQSSVPLHSPGSAAQKTVDGKTYTYWRVYLASGKHNETSLGRKGEPATEAALETKLLESAEMRTLAADVQILRKAGFAAADNSSALTLATLFNAGIFSHGGVLVGSYAFDALLNSLGVRRHANYSTRIPESRRAWPIELAIPRDRRILGILHDSGIPLRDQPKADARQPPISFKARGQLIKVDLLVRGTEAQKTVPLPILHTHAIELPFFRYLVSNPSPGFILGKGNVIPVMLPEPARFALHKLIISTLYGPSFVLRADIDRTQGALLIDALMEKFPDWLSAAAGDLEKRAIRRVATAAARALQLPIDMSERARDYLTDLCVHA